MFICLNPNYTISTSLSFSYYIFHNLHERVTVDRTYYFLFAHKLVTLFSLSESESTNSIGLQVHRTINGCNWTDIYFTIAKPSQRVSIVCVCLSGYSLSALPSVVNKGTSWHSCSGCDMLCVLLVSVLLFPGNSSVICSMWHPWPIG